MIPSLHDISHHATSSPINLYNGINSIYLKFQFLLLHTLESQKFQGIIAWIAQGKNFYSTNRSNLGISKRWNLRKRKRGKTHSPHPIRPAPSPSAARLAAAQPRPGRPPPGRPPPSRGLAGRRCWPHARAPSDPRGERGEFSGRKFGSMKWRWGFI